MRNWWIGGLIGLSAGCGGRYAGFAPDPLPAAADSAEYADFVGGGEQVLVGQAFLATRDGEVKPAAGRLVTLDPATTYALEWFRRRGADVVRFETPAPDPRFVAARRIAIADAEGRFWFARLRPGTYLVRSVVTWEGEGADSSVHAGVVAGLVTVGEGDEQVVVHDLYTRWSAPALGIATVGSAELAGRRHRVLGQVSGASCDPWSEVGARKELAVRAARKGADAVARVECRKRGVSLTRNCWSGVVCEGEAVGWL